MYSATLISFFLTCLPTFHSKFNLIFPFLGGRGLKQAVVIVAVAAKKMAVLSKKADAVVPNLSSKRPHQEGEPVREAPRLPKCVKKLA